jgi:tartrate-resistant acid phosphatase type 5
LGAPTSLTETVMPAALAGSAMPGLPLSAAVVLAGLAAAGCLGQGSPPEAVPPDQDPDAVRFVVVGDTGTGGANQYALAHTIARTCRERGCDFIVHTGDIIYDSGVSSARDPQFDGKFERPYGSLGLPVYLVLGNHDLGEEPADEADLAQWDWREKGDHMVAYAHREDRPSTAWRMPARWYAFSEGKVAFAAFDTTPLLYASLESDAAGPLHAVVSAQQDFASSAWPDEATWRFAVGHHPHFSNGKHGNSAEYRDGAVHGEVLAAFYENRVCPRADVLLVGHDHDLQWLPPAAGCPDTWFLVSGAGARPRALEDPQRNPAAFQRGQVLGFFWLEVRGDQLTVVAFDVEGTELFEGGLQKPGGDST